MTEALATSAPITNLTPGVHQVVATYQGDSNYAGSVSSTLTVNVVIAVPNPTFTLVSPPDAPTGLSSTPGNSQVVLNWTAPANNGGDPVTGYNIYQGTSSGAETILTSTSTTATMFTSTGLTNGTTYYFKVTAVSPAGEGPFSNEVSATPATVAGAPTTLAATASDTEVDLNWTSPANNGGDPVTGYNIYQGTSSGAETILTSTSTTATMFTSTGLTNGTTYYFKVTAVSPAGEGPFSNEVSATPATVAGAPTTLAATASDTEVDLNWTSPANNGGDPVTGYNIYQGTSSGAETILTSTSTTATMFTSTGLTNGTTYYFKVTAVSPAGEGPFSNEVSATPATLPAATSGLSATAGNGRAVLNWTAPANNGGSAITSYNVYDGTSRGGETLLQSTGSSAPTFTVTGLTNGTPYFFEVTAVNGVGEGPVSDEASATPDTLPNAPRRLRATAGNSDVFLRWAVPGNDGGSAVTSYNVYEGTSSGAESLLTSTTNASYTARGLNDGEKYYFEVTAINSVGEGRLSAEVSATPAAPARSPSTTTTTRMAPTTTTAPTTTHSSAQGYLMVGRDGKVYIFGSAVSYGSVEGGVNDVVGMAPTPDGRGYWVVAADGHVFTFGDAHNYSSVDGPNQQMSQVVGISPTTTGRGYWLVNSLGQVAAFGTAHNYGSIHSVLKKDDPIVGIAATADGHGYWLAGSDGAVYAFGDAHNYGSLSSLQVKASDIIGITAAAHGTGYWMIGSDGRVFAFGSATNLGSATSNGNGAANTVGMVRTPDGRGYWTLRANGAVFQFGDARPEGSLPGRGISTDSIMGVSA